MALTEGEKQRIAMVLTSNVGAYKQQVILGMLSENRDLVVPLCDLIESLYETADQAEATVMSTGDHATREATIALAAGMRTLAELIAGRTMT